MSSIVKKRLDVCLDLGRLVDVEIRRRARLALVSPSDGVEHNGESRRYELRRPNEPVDRRGRAAHLQLVVVKLLVRVTQDRLVRPVVLDEFDVPGKECSQYTLHDG